MSNQITWVLGSALSDYQKQYALSAYKHRYTGDYKPKWAESEILNGITYPVQFRDDEEWLAHTEFPVDAEGKIDRTTGSGVGSDCRSHPTWPFGRAIGVEGGSHDRPTRTEVIDALQECVDRLSRYPARDPNGEVWGDMAPKSARVVLRKLLNSR